jgi:hypothetical protein
MRPRVEQLRQDQRQTFRVALIGSALAMAVAYPLLVTAKLTGSLPDHLGWGHVVVGPLVGYGLLLAGMWFSSRLDLKKAREREEGS